MSAVHTLLIMWMNESVAPLPQASSTTSPFAVQVALLEPEAKKMSPVSVEMPQSIPAPKMQPMVQPMMQMLAAVSALPAPAPAPAMAPTSSNRYAPPEPFRMHYVVTKGNDSAKAALTWQISAPASTPANAESKYELTYEATYFGVSVIKQTSVGWVGDSGLSPLRFGDKRRGKSEQATHFDIGKQRVTFSNNRPEASLAMGSQDRSSVLIQLASLLAADPSKSKVGQMMDVPVASTDELETWRFEMQGEEILTLPAGEQATVRLIRRARRAFDQTLELWLAPSLGYVPVRIRQQDSSGVTDAQLSSADKL